MIPSIGWVLIAAIGFSSYGDMSIELSRLAGVTELKKCRVVKREKPRPRPGE